MQLRNLCEPNDNAPPTVKVLKAMGKQPLTLLEATLTGAGKYAQYTKDEKVERDLSPVMR